MTLRSPPICHSRRRSTAKYTVVWLMAAFSALTPSVVSLRLVNLQVPSSVRAHDPVELKCEFDLQNERLYSVKWYKNNIEFFRYQPSDVPPGQVFELQGMFVDLYKSDSRNVYLTKTDVNTEGIYGCEVSTEGPVYQTVKGEREMRVFALPNYGPVIEGLKPSYRLGDRINATCISSPSRPIAKIKWLLNGSEVPPRFISSQLQNRHLDGLQSSQSSVHIEIKRKHLSQGALKFQCVAYIHQTFQRSSQEMFFGQGRRSPLKHSHHANLPDITTSRSDYDVGDQLEANCTFRADGQHPVELFWTVNGRPVKPEHLRHYQPLTLRNLNQEIAVLGMEFRLEPSHFPNDELRLKCVATLSNVIERTSEAYTYAGNHAVGLRLVTADAASTLKLTSTAVITISLMVTVFLNIKLC